MPKFGRSVSEPAESVEEAAGEIERAHLLSLLVENVDKTGGVDRYIGQTSEDRGIRTFRMIHPRAADCHDKAGVSDRVARGGPLGQPCGCHVPRNAIARDRRSPLAPGNPTGQRMHAFVVPWAVTGARREPKRSHAQEYWEESGWW